MQVGEESGQLAEVMAKQAVYYREESIRKMKVVEAKAKPVLKAFEDQVLYVKHNLNSEAIISLKTNVVKMDADVQTLIRDIETATKEADAFIASLPQG